VQRSKKPEQANTRRLSVAVRVSTVGAFPDLMVSNKTKTDQCAHVRDGSADIHQGGSYVSFGGGGRRSGYGYVSLVAIGRLVAFDHRSGSFFFLKPKILRMKEAHRSAGEAA
jgi:hypothetical protein